MRRIAKFDDDGYPHLSWQVTARTHTVTFDANIDQFGEVPSGEGEFSLTLTTDQIRDLLGHMLTPAEAEDNSDD